MTGNIEEVKAKAEVIEKLIRTEQEVGEKWGGFSGAKPDPVEYVINGKKVIVNLPDKSDPKKWYIRKDEVYKPNRKANISKAFRKDFSKIIEVSDDNGKAYKEICELASRSQALNEWLVQQGESYSVNVSVPSYFEGLVSGKVFKEAQANATEISKLSASKNARDEEARRAYQRMLDESKAQFDDQVKDLTNNNLIKALIMPSSKLPLTIACRIEAYTFDKKTQPSRDAYSREIIINFKRDIIKFCEDNNLDFDSAVDSLVLK